MCPSTPSTEADSTQRDRRVGIHCTEMPDLRASSTDSTPGPAQACWKWRSMWGMSCEQKIVDGKIVVRVTTPDTNNGWSRGSGGGERGKRFVCK